MSKIKSGIFSLLAVTTFFIIGIASNSSKRVFKNEEKWIPKDFVPSKTILLVQKFRQSGKSEEKMENYMSEKYPYKYEFVNISTIESKVGKYADTKLYKYALVISSQNSVITKAEGASTSGGIMVTSFDFNFYDRSTGKNYRTTGRPSSYIATTFMPVINTIVKKYE